MSNEREELAETIHKARWPADRQMAVTPFADEDRNGREYCFRIADAILAQRIAFAAAPPQVTNKMVIEAMRAFERMSSVLRYREKDKWHPCDIMGMRDALAAALAVVSRPHQPGAK